MSKSPFLSALEEYMIVRRYSKRTIKYKPRKPIGAGLISLKAHSSSRPLPFD
jgi:hypothetical protein